MEDRIGGFRAGGFRGKNYLTRIGVIILVTKNVDPYEIVGGVPAQKIRFRFTNQEIKSMLRIKWWDWTDEKIKENIHLFYSNVSQFIKSFDTSH